MTFQFVPGAHNLIASDTPGPIKTWSYSSLTKFERCPYAVYLGKVEGISEPAGPAADRGTQIHKVLEDYVRGDIAELNGAGRKPDTELLESLRSAYADGNVSLEDEWTVDRDWTPCTPQTDDVWGVAKLDVFWQQSPTSAVIVDHKSGKSWGNELKHGDQGMVYAIHALTRIPTLEYVEPWFHYVDEKIIVRKNAWTRDDLNVFLPRLTQRAKRLTSATDFPPKPSASNCKYCRYKKEVVRENGQPACQWGVLA